MDGYERVSFDFSVDGSLAAVEYLEDILSSGHWSDRHLDYNDERVMLLLRLLRFGDIAVYKRAYPPITETPDLWCRARDMNMFMNKRYEGGMLLYIASIFSGYEFDGHRTEYNSLFFPELKAYARHGGLPPDRLLGLLEREGCEKVFLFPNDYKDDESVFFVFTLAVPKEQFLEELEKTNERIMEMIYEKARKNMVKYANLIPKIDKWPKNE